MMHGPITSPPGAAAPGRVVAHSCEGCRGGAAFPVPITMAFQPIVDLATGSVFAYEALVRGVDGATAADVLAGVAPDMIYKFDQLCRVTAIELAGRLFTPGGSTRLSINFMPNAVYEPDACIRASLAAARRVGFNPALLMSEFTEGEPMRDVAHVRTIIEAYRKRGFTTAIDDFGAGYAGLSLLADLQPDILKIDMTLIRGIDASAGRQAIVAGIVQMAGTLNVRCIAEGVETEAEVRTLRDLGIRFYQGYWFARPQIAALPVVRPAVTPTHV